MRRLVDNIVPIRRFLRSQAGATAIEYAIIASGVSIAIAATITSLGSSVKTNLYDKLSTLF